jgi:alpha-tubulin suppressor-like RCC1 family protein
MDMKITVGIIPRSFACSGSVRFPLLVLSLLLTAACGSDGPGEPAAGKVVRITVSPDDVVLAVGESKQLTGTAVDSKGDPLSGATLAWQSADKNVVTVDATGLVEATGAGATEITASGGETSTRIPIKVTLAANRLAFATHPEDIEAGSGFTSALRVEVHDAGGHLVAGSQAEITLSLAGGSEGATLLGTITRSAVGGIASFEGLRVERAGSGYRIEAKATGLPAQQSEVFTVSPAAVHHLAFTKAPEAVEGLTPFAAEVEARDRFGNNVSTWTGEVTLSLENNPGTDTLAGTRLATAANGTATFTDLSLANPGYDYTLRAEAVGPAAAESTPFDVRLTFAMVSSGSDHTCGVTTTGKVYCWGSAEYGQVGNGGNSDSSVPVPVTGNLEFSLVSAGSEHTCGMTTTGEAYCWGYGGAGTLGNSAYEGSPIPKLVSGGLTFVSLRAGGDHTCGITIARKAYCWGLGTDGQLGFSATSMAPYPVPVSGPFEFVAVDAGASHSCGLTVAAVAYCWGRGASGQLGNGATANVPVPESVRGGHEFTMLAVGQYHVCGITNEGASYCWGWGAHGQLGDGDTQSSSVPVQITGNLAFATLSGGLYHTCGLTTTGKAYCWGSEAKGELGIGGGTEMRLAPAPVSGDLNFAMISSGNYHVCGLTTDQKVYCWGDGESGKLGNKNTENSSVPVPVFGTER